jgi:hypothetical protein
MAIRLDVERYLDRCNIPKEAMHVMLSHFVKRAMSASAAHRPKRRLHLMMVRRYVKFKIKNQLILVSPTGRALCLLKTQFAKKPKNPV